MLCLDVGSVLAAGRSYSLHIEDMANAWRYPEHTHSGFGDLIAVERGFLHQRVNGEEMRLGPGDLLLIRPGDRHALWGDGFRFYNLNLPTVEWERLAAYAGPQLGMARLATLRQAPRASLGPGDSQELFSDLAGLITGDTAVRVALGRLLLRWLPAFSAAAEERSRGPDWLQPLMQRMEEGVGSGLVVTDLPRLAGVSQAHLARSFRRHLGTTPSQHLNRLRLRQAAVQLARTGRDILDIGYGLGFKSPSYFYRLFARSYAMPPAAYRRRHRMPGDQS